MLVLFWMVVGAHFAAGAETGDPLAQIKGYLAFKLERMDAATHDYVANANAYQAIIDKFAGDYDRAAIEQGPQLLQLITKMQDDYRVYHNHGYETIEGITAGTKAMVAFEETRSPRERRAVVANKASAAGLGAPETADR